MCSRSFSKCFSGFCRNEEENIAVTGNGKIRGTLEKTENGHTFHAFRGVPFAQPPVDHLRFAPPVKPLRWKGVLDATKQKPECVQSYPSYVRTDKISGSEDCLYLNIYTPNLPKGKERTAPYPVMVWIHGGGFFQGDNSYQMYNPDLFIEEGIVVVTISYRLGVFGFLTTEDLTCPGNNGLRDQIMALLWVRHNIHCFGGNNFEITAWGESAGAVSVSHLLVSPQGEHLFERAILQSGSSLMQFSVGQQQRSIALKLGELLGIKTDNSEELISKLREVDYRTLHAYSQQAALLITLTSPLEIYPFTAVIEPNHKDAVLTVSPFVVLESYGAHVVPILMGFNSLEGTGLPDSIVRATLSSLQMNSVALVPPNLGAKPEDLQTIGDAIKEEYFKGDTTMYSEDNFLQWFGDMNLIRPIIKQADLLSRSHDLFLYEFNYAGYLGDPYRTQFAGAGHAEELNYLFLRLSSPPVLPPTDLTVRKKLVRMWSDFAKTGFPNTTGAKAILDNVFWEFCKPYPNMHYLHITDKLVSCTNPRDERMKFWDNIFETYGTKPFVTY